MSTDLKTSLQAAGALASLKKEEPTCPQIDFQKRLIFFVVQAIIGLLLVINNIFHTDSVYYLTAGIIILFTSTLWLINYKKLFSKMLEPIRFLNAMILFGCMIGSIVLSILHVHESIIFIIAIVESVAGVWYMLSFIPFAQNLTTQCCKGCCNACQKSLDA